MRWIVVLLMLTNVACSNDPSPFCGDGSCNSGESCSTCAMDCGSCPASCGDGSCGSGESCSSCPSDCGSCTPTECSTTCGGCCDGDACLTGSSSSACGSGGLACVDCGPDTICMDGACYIDPASRWNVVLETLTVSATRYDGAAWDTLGGSPDLFVQVATGDTTIDGMTGVANDTYSVVFAPGATVSGARADEIANLLYFEADDDDIGSHEAIGQCAYTPAAPFLATAWNGVTQTLSCPTDSATMNSGFTLTWHLERF